MSISKAGIVRGAADVVGGGPAHEGLFPADALLELLSFLPHQEVGCPKENCVHAAVRSCAACRDIQTC